MSIEPVRVEYEGRLRELRAGWAQGRRQRAATVTMLLIAVSLSLALGAGAIRRRIPLWWPALPLAVAAGAARRLGRQRQTRSRTWRLMRYYERAIQRVTGTWQGQG